MEDDITIGDWARVLTIRPSLLHPFEDRMLEVGDFIRIDACNRDFVGYKHHGHTCTSFGRGYMAVFRNRVERVHLEAGDMVECTSDDLMKASHPAENRRLRQGDRVIISASTKDWVDFPLDDGMGMQTIPTSSIRLVKKGDGGDSHIPCTCRPDQLFWGGHTCGRTNTDGTVLLS